MSSDVHFSSVFCGVFHTPKLCSTSEINYIRYLRSVDQSRGGTKFDPHILIHALLLNLGLI